MTTEPPELSFTDADAFKTILAIVVEANAGYDDPIAPLLRTVLEPRWEGKRPSADLCVQARLTLLQLRDCPMPRLIPCDDRSIEFSYEEAGIHVYLVPDGTALLQPLSTKGLHGPNVMRFDLSGTSHKRAEQAANFLRAAWRTKRPQTTNLPPTKLPYAFLSFSGLIGAGKTTLATKLSEKLDMKLYLERVENQKLLGLFYADMATYAFPLQIDLLTHRLAEQHNITWSGGGAVQDRSFYEDLAFARTLTELGKMSPVELEVYENLYSTVMRTMQHPTCVVFLDVSPTTALERIKSRGRANEQGITLEYLEVLHRHYMALLDEISRTVRVISIDWNAFSDEHFVVEALERELYQTKQITKLVPL